MRSINCIRNGIFWQTASAKYTIQTLSIRHAHQASSDEKEYKEIEVDMPWGFVAAKWWGRQDVRPVLVVHGWQDNAGSFDRLLPLLPKHVGYLAIDLPGHGRSSHFPPGMYYSSLDSLRALETLRLQMKWDRLSLLAHSMGSQLSFTYAALKPDKVDMIIGLDVLKPLMRKTTRLIDDGIKQIDQMMIEDSRQKTKNEPPSYTNEELIERLVKGTSGSVSAEFAPYLLHRGVSPSTKHTNKFYFHRDNRLKYLQYMTTFPELSLALAQRITAPHLFIKAKQAGYFEDEEYFYQAIDELKKCNPLFEWIRVDGGHHVHLTQPENVSSLISKFICKYRPDIESAKCANRKY